MQFILGKWVDECADNSPATCAVCGKETDEWDYMGFGKNRVLVCPECADNAIECEDCGRATRDYEEHDGCWFCDDCAKKVRVG